MAKETQRSPSRKHDRESFFKYATAETALVMLQGKTLRFRNPLEFNDPFDNNVSFVRDFSLEELIEACLEEIDSIVARREFEKFSDESKIGGPLRMGLSKSFTNFIESFFDQFKESLRLSIPEGLSRANLEKYNADFKKFVKDSVVFCVSEQNDSLLMWAHYASQHEGVVLELACIDELDNILLAAEPVVYVEKFPELATIQHYVAFFTGQKKHLIDHRSGWKQIVFSKSLDWTYEKEWRVWWEDELSSQYGYLDMPQDPQMFKAIYLGCRIEPEMEDKIISKIRGDDKLRHMEIYKTKTCKSRYALEFSKVVF